MATEKRRHAEPLPGYRLLEKLGAGGFGEVWKCEAPGGLFKAIKFVYGNVKGVDANSQRAQEELQAIQHVKSIRHPFLLSIDRLEVAQDEVVIVTELADKNLYDVWRQYNLEGNAGIPRQELLSFLTEVAEVLDLLNLQYDLQHLDIKPRNLFVVANHVKVADFGLVSSLGGSAAPSLRVESGAITPIYAAPELFLNRFSRFSDQYSLAIVYQELLTGTLPFSGKNYRQLYVQHTEEQPDLRALPEEDQPIIAKALSKYPEQRFPSCRELVRALKASKPSPDRPNPSAPIDTPPPGETQWSTGRKTQKLRSHSPPLLPSSVMTGVKWVEFVHQTPVMDVWRVLMPDHRERIAKILFGMGGNTQKLDEAVRRLQSIQHPGLLPLEIAHAGNGMLILLSDPVKKNVREQYNFHLQNRKAGIPREEMLGYLLALAEMLDYLYTQHNLLHLTLSPRKMVLDQGWMQLDEFGFAQVFWQPSHPELSQLNPRYSAPELSGRRPHRNSDQYSLALFFAELTTGEHPFGGQSAKQTSGAFSAPKLENLSELDRAIITKALDPEPRKRWASCTEMVHALEGKIEGPEGIPEDGDRFATYIARTREDRRPSVYTGISPTDAASIISKLVEQAGGKPAIANVVPPELAPDGETLFNRFPVGSPLGSVKDRLLDFADQVYAQVSSEDETSCTMRFDFPRNFWHRWWKQNPSLQFRVQLARTNPSSATPVEVSAELQAYDCSRSRKKELLGNIGRELFERLQQHLLINAEKRGTERLLWPHPVTVYPFYSNGQKDDAIECRGKDISLNGMGFYLPHDLSTTDLLVELPGTEAGSVILMPAMLVRAKPVADGWYEVGTLFRMPSMLKELAELHVVT